MSSNLRTDQGLAKRASDKEIREFLRALANVGEVEADLRHFLRKHESALLEYSLGSYIERQYPTVTDEMEHVLRMRDSVRRIWHGGLDAEKLLTDYLCEDVPIHHRVENFRQDILRVDLRRQRLEYQPRNSFQKALYFLLVNFSKAKVCANAECPAPYFIAERASARYCSTECLEELHRQSKLEWWNRVGKFERASRKRSKTGAKKGR